jgi:hypothetical protein
MAKRDDEAGETIKEPKASNLGYSAFERFVFHQAIGIIHAKIACTNPCPFDRRPGHPYPYSIVQWE